MNFCYKDFQAENFKKNNGKTEKKIVDLEG